ncbi:MAG: hypothetical protein ABSD57_12220 [Verrucomicrobiota bacterium]|jgi:hypothetical protein
MTTNDVSEILEKVNLFYSQSFSTLTAYAFGLLGLVGVLIPLLFSWYQNQKSKLEEKHLLGVMENRFEEVAKKAGEAAEKATLEAVKNVEEELKKEVARLEGGICMQQEKIFCSGSLFALATISCIRGAESCLYAEHEGTVRAILGDLTEFVLPRLTKLQIEEYVVENIPSRIDDLIKKLEAKNEKSRFQDCIIKIKQQFAKAMKR